MHPVRFFPCYASGPAARPSFQGFLAALASVTALTVPSVHGADLPSPLPLGDPVTTVYRQVGRDGTVIYSDRPLGNAALDATLTIAPLIPGNGWATQPGKGATVPPQVLPTPVTRKVPGGASDRPGTPEDADTRVIQAEMLMEEARNRLALSRSGSDQPQALSPDSVMGDDLEQRALLREVEEAEQAWIAAVKARSAVRGAATSVRQATLQRSPDAETVSRGYERLKD